MKRNPKQEGTCLYDCIPQAGKCPSNCNQCFFNRQDAFYTEVPSIPTPEEIGDGIVRMNCGNDSNNQRELVIETAKQYKHFFFNTSVPRFNFPGPVVLTANPKEEEPAWTPIDYAQVPRNLMFVRLRVSCTNLHWIDEAVRWWTIKLGVPVVLTFMAYKDYEPQVPTSLVFKERCYEWRIRHINSYWCPTKEFMRWVLSRYRSNRLVSMCGSIESPYCLNCRNCETYYWQTMKRLKGE